MRERSPKGFAWGFRSFGCALLLSLRDAVEKRGFLPSCFTTSWFKGRSLPLGREAIGPSPPRSIASSMVAL
jgi:hypothetical protein